MSDGRLLKVSILSLIPHCNINGVRTKAKLFYFKQKLRKYVIIKKQPYFVLIFISQYKEKEGPK